MAEQARLFEAFAAGTVLESVALKAVLVMSALLFQKPSATSKAKDHTAALARQLTLWHEGNILHGANE